MKIWIGNWSNSNKTFRIKIEKFEMNGNIIEIFGSDYQGNFTMSGAVEEGIFNALQYYSSGEIFRFKGLFDQLHNQINGLWTTIEDTRFLGFFELKKIEENLVNVYEICKDISK